MARITFWAGLSFTVCLIGAFVRFGPLLGTPLELFAPIPAGGTPGFERFLAFDQRYQIWVIARNAEVLSSSPSRLFEANQCYPTQHSLAFGHSVVTLGLLAAPLHLLVKDPIALHNILWLSTVVAAGLVMTWLGTEWTGSPQAGLLGGTFYAFHRMKIGSSMDFFHTDTVWLVIALGVLVRLVAKPRWATALVLGVAVALQLGASVYPAYGAAIVGVAALIALACGGAVRREALAPLGLAGALSVGASALLYVPYLQFQNAGLYIERTQFFFDPRRFLPTGDFFPGWLPLALATLALFLPVAPRRGAPPRGFVWGLAMAALLITWIATGGHFPVPPTNTNTEWTSIGTPVATPFYVWLQKWLPGLRIGRGPFWIYGGTHVCLSILVAFGCAGLLGRIGSRWRRLAEVISVLAALTIAFDGGLIPHVGYEFVRQRPSEERLAFFRGLDAVGNRGPMLELPVVHELEWEDRASASLLSSAYHHRQTSECWSSFYEGYLPTNLLIAIDALPSSRALAAIRRTGFTTILVHLEGATGAGQRLADRLQEAAESHAAPLRVVGRAAGIVAFEIVPTDD